MKSIGLILILLWNIGSFATLRILTFHYNQPGFVELQYKTLRKFLKDDFELIVFNDAKTAENEKAIEKICNDYQIKHVRFKQEWHLTDPLNSYLLTLVQDPNVQGKNWWDASTTIKDIGNQASVRHCHVIKYAMEQYGYDHDDIVVIMDGDNFLIKPLSIREMLGDNDIIGFHQGKDLLGAARKKWQVSVPKNSESLWVVFMAFRPRNLPNPRDLEFHIDVVNNHPWVADNTIYDTGAAIFKYLHKHPDLKLQAYPWIDCHTIRSSFSLRELRNIGFSDRLIRFIYEIMPDSVQFFLFEAFLHFEGVSWKKEDHGLKASYLTTFINDIINEQP